MHASCLAQFQTEELVCIGSGINWYDCLQFLACSNIPRRKIQSDKVRLLLTRTYWLTIKKGRCLKQIQKFGWTSKKRSWWVTTTFLVAESTEEDLVFSTGTTSQNCFIRTSGTYRYSNSANINVLVLLVPARSTKYIPCSVLPFALVKHELAIRHYDKFHSSNGRKLLPS